MGYSTTINNWPQFGDLSRIKRTELSRTCRRVIHEKEIALNKQCRRIFLEKNIQNEVYIFAHFVNGKDVTLVTLAYYVPFVGFVTSH